MLSICEEILSLDELTVIAFLSIGKSLKETLLIHYESTPLYNKIKENIDDNYTFNFLAKTDKELLLFLKILNYIKLEKNQKIKIRIYSQNMEEIKKILLQNRKNDNYDKCFIGVDNRGEFVPLDFYILYANYVDQIKKQIPENASNLEIITYIYDFVKKKQYNDNKEDIYASRMLVSSALSKYIVCAGYVKIFNNLLREFNINCTEYNFWHKLDGEKKGHSTSIVNIDDEKYKINGLYFFDPTFDSANPKDKNNELKYKYFMLNYDNFRSKYFNIEDNIDNLFEKTPYNEVTLNKLQELSSSETKKPSLEMEKKASKYIFMSIDLFGCETIYECFTDNYFNLLIYFDKLSKKYNSLFKEELDENSFKRLMENTKKTNLEANLCVISKFGEIKNLGTTKRL